MADGAGRMVCIILHLWVDQQYVDLSNEGRTFLECNINRCYYGTGVGEFQSYYETVLLSKYSASTIAWIPSLQIFFMFAMVSQRAEIIETIPWPSH